MGTIKKTGASRKTRKPRARTPARKAPVPPPQAPDELALSPLLGRLYDTIAAAKLLQMSEKSLERLGGAGGGPPFHRLRRRKIVYAQVDLVNWVNSGRRTSTSDPGPGAGA